MAVTLRDFMSSGDVLTIEPSATLGEAARALRKRDVGAAVVVDGGRVVGIFTERDLLQRVDHKTLAWRDTPVRDVMTSRPMIIREDDSVAEALRRIDVGKRRHLPIMRGREPIAIVSVRDLLGYIASRFPGDFINLPPTPEKEARAPYGG